MFANLFQRLGNKISICNANLFTMEEITISSLSIGIFANSGVSSRLILLITGSKVGKKANIRNRYK